MEELWLWPGGLQASVLYRALSYLPNSTAISFRLAEIEEELGHFEKAHTVLIKIAEKAPLSTASLRRLQLEQRNTSDVENVRKIFEEVYTEMPGVEEASEIALKFSNYLRVKGNYSDAKDILDRALEVDDKNSKLYSNKIMLLKFLDPSEVINVCEKALASDMTNEMKVQFAQEKIYETEAMGLSLEYVKEAKMEYQNIVKSHRQNKQPKPGLTCDSCDAKVADLRSLRNHKTIMHSGPVKCERCLIDFADKYTLKMHIEKCLWKCSVCPYNSMKRYNLIKHEKLKHS